MATLEILRILTPIFLLALMGFVFEKYIKLDLKIIADIVIYFASPALVFTMLLDNPVNLQEFASISLSAAFVMLGAGLISYIISKSFDLKLPVGLYLPIMSMNSGYLGFPIIYFALGQFALSKAIIYNLTNVLILFSVGIYIVSQGKDRFQFLKIPFLPAAMAGLLFSSIGLKVPTPIYFPLYFLGQAAIPLSLFMLGYRLAKTKIGSVKLPLLTSLLRLGLGLCLGIIAVYIFGLQGITAKVVILLSSLASGITSIALAEEYGSDPDLVAATIALSTLLSVGSLIFLLNWLL